MSPNKPTSKKEGGIDLKSDAAKISGSDVAGRDIKGFSGKDVNQIIETLLKYFPKGYLQNPDELDKTLSEFRFYHEKLYEYKELHNGINQILITFEPFKIEIDNSDSRRSLPPLNRLKSVWLPVSVKVDLLLKWSQTIKYIGEPYQRMEDNSKSGVDWAVDFSNSKDEINKLLGLSERPIEHLRYPSKVQIFAFQRFEREIPWWKEFIDSTSRFGARASLHMNSADLQLRQTAQELFNLSNKALSSY